jgi:hypothetical protein
MDEQLTPELGRQMLARRLIQHYAALRGYPDYANEAQSELFLAYLALPAASRPATFHEYVIEILS